MRAPLVPCRESGRWVVDGFTAVEFASRWNLEVGSPLGEFLVGHGPGRVRRFGLALITSSALLGRGELEVAQLHRRAQVCCGPAEGGALVPAPEAVVDHDVVAQFKGAQPDLDEPSSITSPADGGFS